MRLRSARGHEEPTTTALAGYALLVLLGIFTLGVAVDDFDAALDARRGPLAIVIAPALILGGTIRFIVLWRRRQ